MLRNVLLRRCDRILYHSMRDLETLLAPAPLPSVASATGTFAGTSNFGESTATSSAASTSIGSIGGGAPGTALCGNSTNGTGQFYRSINSVLRTSDHAPVDAVFNLRCVARHAQFNHMLPRFITMSIYQLRMGFLKAKHSR
eukprot:SAG31_NODE_1239_length_9169_cov_18.922492_15_plen_141_part_00